MRFISKHPWQNSRPSKWVYISGVFLCLFIYFFCLLEWICPPSNSCAWSRWTVRWRTIPGTFSIWRALPTSRTARSVSSTYPASVSGVRHTCQRTVPKRISPLSWSGCWRTTDLHSPSAPQRRTSPAPLTYQRPVSCHPAARSHCLSPPQTESLRPPRLSQSSSQSRSLKHRLTKCVSRQHCPSPREFWWWSRAWREAPPTLPWLRVSCNWFLGTILRNLWTSLKWIL